MTRSTTRWPPHWEEGQRYDLSHVYPFKFNYVLPANQQFAERIVRIQASFTSHAFTRKCEADETPHPHYCAPGEARVFDHERYGFSQLLPNGEENDLQSPRLKGVGRRETKTTALKKQTPPAAGFVCRSS